MASFCTRCGANIGNSTKCPRCGKRVKKPGDKKPPIDRYLRLAAAILAGMLALVMLIAILVYYDVVKIPFINDIFIYMDMKDASGTGETKNEAGGAAESMDLSKPYSVPAVDAEQHFEEIADVLSDFDAATSKDLHSEEDAYQNLTERGFTQNAITTSYDQNGTYTSTYEIYQYSSYKHPTYETEYVSPSGEYWVIAEINGSVYATPAVYNLENPDRTPIIVSESETLTGYDSATNRFYLIEPDKDVMKVVVVSRIDTNTLDNLTFGG